MSTLGRPLLEPSKKKLSTVAVRLRPEERKLLEQAAHKQRQSLSVWVRNTLVNAASSV